MAKEFHVETLCVEEALTESVYEHWMRWGQGLSRGLGEAPVRQWAVPGANSKWGGPARCCMPKGRLSGDPRQVRGAPVAEEDLRPEALEGAMALKCLKQETDTEIMLEGRE